MTLLTWVLVLAAAGAALAFARRRPKSDRDWASDHARPARVTLLDGEVRIRDLRDLHHTAPNAFTERYRDVEFELDQVRGVWLVLAPFARPRLRPLAHTFVSFELEGDRYVAVSVEARREVDEPYSIVGGLLRRFEITYVIGTERDLIGLRALRGDPLHLYRSVASPRRARSLFRDMLERAERVRTRPEFYHSIVNNCATNLRDHLNRVIDDPLPWGWGVVFPGLLDRFAREHGLLEVRGTLAQTRTDHRVEHKALEAMGESAAEFSRAIRAGLPERAS